MVVKEEANPIKRIQAIAKEQDSFLLDTALLKHGIPRMYRQFIQ
jgi:hypothetical protein